MSSTATLSDGATKLRSWREANGKTQKDVADALGVYVVTVGGWERGHQRPALDSILALERMTAGQITARDWSNAAKAA